MHQRIVLSMHKKSFEYLTECIWKIKWQIRKVSRKILKYRHQLKNWHIDDNPYSLKWIGMILHYSSNAAQSYVPFSSTNKYLQVIKNCLPITANTSPAYNKFKIFTIYRFKVANNQVYVNAKLTTMTHYTVCLYWL